MAKIMEWDEQEKQEWEEWVKTRPEIIQDLCKSFPPYNLYQLKASGHRVIIYSYSENNTLTVKVLGKFNLITFERQVFGVKPEDLEECDIPSPDEKVGVMLTDPADIDKFIDEVRPFILGEKGHRS